jgi:hypothetical protein
MFLVLAGFCCIFLIRERAKKGNLAKFRALIYVICGVAMVIAVGVLFVAAQHSDMILPYYPRAVFWGERLGLTAFGLAWLTASQLLPLIDVWKPIQHKIAAVRRRLNKKTTRQTGEGNEPHS